MNETIIDLYDRTAGAFDAARDQSLSERVWLDRFLGDVRPGGRILDLGCGSGRPIADYLIARGYEVTGVDSSAAMIATCRERFPAQEWIVADMRALDLAGLFDGILAWHSLFHLSREDQTGVIEKIGRLAAPGAAFMFTSGPDEGEAIGEWQGEPLYHASLAPAQYEALLAAAGFGVLAFQAEDAACGGASVWLARQMRPASGLDGSA